MERFKATTSFIQIQLWQDCKNGCKFCSEKQYYSNKKEDLEFAFKLLNSDEVLQYDEIGLIGGEFFDDQLDNEEVRKMFYELCYKITNMHFKKFYIATSLLFDIDKHLVPFLKQLEKWKVPQNVLICTSYDTKWRFDGYKTGKPKKSLFRKNMRRLHEELPDFPTHIEIILTGDFIDKVLNNEFDIGYFSNYYKSRVDFIEPTSGLHFKDKYELQKICPNFFPTKTQFVNFIKQECIEKKTVDLRCLISYQIRASRVYHKDMGKFVCYEDRRQPDFKQFSLDKDLKVDVGLIDSDESMESICTQICEMLPDDLYSNIRFL